MTFRRVLVGLCAAVATLGMVNVRPAAAQGVSAEQVATGFVEAIELCVSAKAAGVGVSDFGGSDRARVAEAGIGARQFVNAPEGRPAWEVMSARGVVIIVEPTESECNVTAYGPRVRETFDRVAETLAAEFGFSELNLAQTPSASIREFARTHEGILLRVRLDGSEPGMPNHYSRFSVLAAFVSAGPVPATQEAP